MVVLFEQEGTEETEETEEVWPLAKCGRIALILWRERVNRQDFSHREADERSLLDEVVRRGRGERWGRLGTLNGRRLVNGNNGTVKRGFSF